MMRITAVVVTYNNAVMLAPLLRSIDGQNRRPDEIVVVDNASTDATPSVMARFPGIIYIRLSRNTGSAGGYAKGFQAALERGCDLLWTLDDDVRLFPESLSELVKTLEKFPTEDRVGAVRSVGEGCSWTSPVPMSIFSWRGTLFTAEAVKRAGPPERAFFLYGEDLEYSLRLKRLGYRFYWAPGSRCVENRIEGKTEMRMLGQGGRVYLDPLRLYYAFRNEIYVYISYRQVGGFLRVLAYSFKLSAAFILLRPVGAAKRIQAIVSGIVDGIRGRLGERIR